MRRTCYRHGVPVHLRRGAQTLAGLCAGVRIWSATAAQEKCGSEAASPVTA